MDYKASVEETSEVERRISVEIPVAAFEQRFASGIDRIAGQAHVKGFRPGRAPRAMVVKLYGQQVHVDTVNRIVNDAYHDVIKSNALQVVGMPEIELGEYKPGTPIKFTAQIALLPSPAVKDYRQCSFEVEIEEVVEEDIERVLSEMREKQRTLQPLDRAQAAVGDIATVVVRGPDGELINPKSSDEFVFEIGKGEVLADIDSATAKMAVGEEREVLVTDHHGHSHAEGEKCEHEQIRYRITLKSLSQKILPELDDSFARSTGAAETLAELRQVVRDRLVDQVENANNRAREQALFDAIAGKNPFLIPQVMVDDEIRAMFMEQGFLDSKDKGSYTIDVSPFRERMGKVAEKRVRNGILLRQILKQETFEIGQEDFDRWYEKQAKRMNYPKAQVVEMFKGKKQLARIRETLEIEKAVDSLIASSKVTERKSVRSESNS